jgi:hypothetical protein
MAQVYHATGQVIDAQTSQGLGGLTVEAWDASSSLARPLATTKTADDGRFTVEMDFEQFGFKQIPDVVFKVLQNGQQMEAIESGVAWNANSEEAITLLVRVVVRDTSKGKDRVTAKQVLKTADFFQQSDFLGLFLNVKEKIGTRWGTIADAVSNSLLKTEMEPIKPGRNFEKEVVGTDVNTAKKNLEEQQVEVKVLKYNPRVNKATLQDLTSFSNKLKPGQKVNLYEENGTVKYMSVVKEKKAVVAEPKGDDTQREDLKKLGEELKASREESLRKDKQIIELQQELLTIKQDHIEIKQLLKSKEFDALLKSVGKKPGEDKPK